MLKDRAATDKLAAELAPLYANGRISDLQEKMEVRGGELGGRLMLLDETGKVQLDSFSQLNGARLELPEVASILSMGKAADFGVHELTGDGSPRTLRDYLKPYDPDSEWANVVDIAPLCDGKTK
jgi:hypothetical protein